MERTAELAVSRLAAMSLAEDANEARRLIEAANRELLQSQMDLHTLNAELEQRVRQRTAQQEATLQELEAFSSSVAHDLRAPLRAVAGFSHILATTCAERLDAEGLHLLRVIAGEALRMGCLVDDLLAFSRMSRLTLGPTTIDMTALAQAVFDEQAAQAQGRALRLELAPIPKAYGDPAMLRVVMVNLMANAIKYTKPRDPAVIEIGCRQEDGTNVYFIKDNGVGFDMKYVHKLFGIFQRLHTAEEFEGTGVGLALVQRILHRHGGRAWAEAILHEGATFFFTLPNPPGGQP